MSELSQLKKIDLYNDKYETLLFTDIDNLDEIKYDLFSAERHWKDYFEWYEDDSRVYIGNRYDKDEDWVSIFEKLINAGYELSEKAKEKYEYHLAQYNEQKRKERERIENYKKQWENRKYDKVVLFCEKFGKRLKGEWECEQCSRGLTVNNGYTREKMCFDLVKYIEEESKNERLPKIKRS